jgi:hypothetical protein
MNFDLIPARRGSVAVRELLRGPRPFVADDIHRPLDRPFLPGSFLKQLGNINHYGSYALPPA